MINLSVRPYPKVVTYLSGFSLLILAVAATGTAQATTILDYTVVAGTTQILSSTVDLSGVTATVTGRQLERTNAGLGVVGGVSDYLIDATELVKFTFDAGSATGVSFEADVIFNLDFSKSRPTALLTGFGAGGASLGTFAFLPFSTPNNILVLSNYFGSVPLSGFSVQGNETGLAVAKITFNAPLSAAPEPSTALLGATAALLLFAGRGTRYRKMMR